MSATAPPPFFLHSFGEYIFPGGPRKAWVGLRRQMGGGWRTPRVSAEINDSASKRFQEQLRSVPQADLFDRVVLLRGQESYLLKDHRVTYGDRSEVEAQIHRRLEEALGLEPGSNAKVLEFGCSHGRNLFWLKRKHPGLSLHGVDISTESVRLGKELSGRLGLPVELSALSDHRIPYPDKFFDVSFTKHCIEQCPCTYRQILQELFRVTKDRVVLLEPIRQMYPLSWRGLLGRLHGFYNNYSEGVYSYLEEASSIRHRERLGWATNPLNETCLVVLEPPS